MCAPRLQLDAASAGGHASAGPAPPRRDGHGAKGTGPTHGPTRRGQALRLGRSAQDKQHYPASRASPGLVGARPPDHSLTAGLEHRNLGQHWRYSPAPRAPAAAQARSARSLVSIASRVAITLGVLSSHPATSSRSRHAVALAARDNDSAVPPGSGAAWWYARTIGLDGRMKSSKVRSRAKSLGCVGMWHSAE